MEISWLLGVECFIGEDHDFKYFKSVELADSADCRA